MGKSKRDKTANYKSIDERMEIVEELKQKIDDLALSESYPAISEFYSILREYSKPNLTSGFSGTIPFYEAKRDIVYVLPLRKMTEAYVNLRVRE